MSKILIISCVYAPEPIVSAQISEALVENLIQRDHEITLLAPEPSRPDGYDFGPKYKIKKLLKFRSEFNFNAYYLPSFVFSKQHILGRFFESLSFGYFSFLFIIKSKIKYDVVYMNTWPIFAQLGVSLACLIKNIPYVIHVMDIYPESFGLKLPRRLRKCFIFFLLPIDSFVLRKSKKIVAISIGMKEYLSMSRKISFDKIAIVYTFQNQDIDSVISQNIVNPKCVFMFLGNIGPVAGVQFLIEAFSEIRAKLIIAGSGSHKDLSINYSKQFPNLDIEFLKVPNGHVAEIQSMADVLLLPISNGSGTTSIPSKLSSYMFSQKPIIVAADINTETALNVLEAKCGWVVDYGDVRSFRSLVNQILAMDKKQLNAMGLSGYYFAKDKFSKNINVNSLMSAILD